MGTAFLSQGVKRLGCDCDHSPSVRAVGKNEWGYLSTLPVRLHVAEKDTFTITKKPAHVTYTAHHM